MGLQIGNVNIKEIYLGNTKIAQMYLGSTKVYEYTPDNVLIFKFSNSYYDPSSLTTLTGATWTRISTEPNVWKWDARNVQTTDWTMAFYRAFKGAPASSATGYVNIISAGVLTIPTVLGRQQNPWPGMFRECLSLTDVCVLRFPNVTFSPQIFNGCKNVNLAGLYVPNTTSLNSAFKAGNNQTSNFTHVGQIVTSSALTDVEQMFYGAHNMIEAPYFETSGVRMMKSILYNCSSIKSIPLYHTDSVTNVDTAFRYCYNVESGALAMYQQLSSLANTPGHSNTFLGCGRDTTTGAAELAQIPSSWGGTGV